jgi:selenophosphate synthetase-related protein
MHPGFVAQEPWFAGFCAVMTNVSDIAAMGGRAQAIVDVLFAGTDERINEAVLAGMAAGSSFFDVPLVGGHTGRSPGETYLSAAIVGRARKLISSFAARPGDALIACYDLRGRFRPESSNFDAVSGSDPKRVRAQLALLPELAEAGLVHAGKDVSMAGFLGTLVMLLETSGVGATLDLAQLPAPADAEPLRWLRAFPSFGYILVSPAACSGEVLARAHALGLSAQSVGEIQAGSTLQIQYGDQSYAYWDLARTPLLGFGPRTEEEPRHA